MFILTLIESDFHIEKLISLTINSIIGVPAKATGPKTQTTTGQGAVDSEQPNFGG
jgi:hypothetical protein